MAYNLSASGPPTQIDMATPASVKAEGAAVIREYEQGRQVAAQSGCLACHKIGENGNSGPGPELTDIADRLPAAGIQRTLINPTAPMPSFKSLQENEPEKFKALVTFLGRLKEDEGAKEGDSPDAESAG